MAERSKGKPKKKPESGKKRGRSDSPPAAVTEKTAGKTREDGPDGDRRTAPTGRSRSRTPAEEKDRSGTRTGKGKPRGRKKTAAERSRRSAGGKKGSTSRHRRETERIDEVEAEAVVEVLPPEDEEIVGADLPATPDQGQDKPVIYDPVSAYYQTIRHYPVLSREEERRIALNYLETEDLEAAYKLVTSNLKLVIKIALEYRRMWKEIIDLIQEGNVGLMHAVKKYDPYRGVRFSSYAAWWIRAYIIRYIMNNTRMVKLGTTQAQRTLYFQLGKERERLRRMGIEPDTKALAKSLDVKESEVEEMSMRLSGGDVSLEAERGSDGDFTLLDALPGETPDAEALVADAETRAIYLEKVTEFVAGLDERDRKIFTMRWMRDDPLTLQEIGEKLGITRERVRQLEARIMKNLKSYLEEEGYSASDFLS